MTANLIQECRDYLQKAYRDKLGVHFSDSISQIQTGRQPVWRWVSPDDLLTEVEPASSGAFGLLLDPEIGLLCYLAPFNPATDLRRQITCAVALRARLSIDYREEMGQSGQPNSGDPRGAWQIVLHWLVEPADRDDWIRDVAELRRESRFSEAVSLDAVFIDEQEDIERQLAQHGFPRLLLVTREVFRKKRADELERWMSADDLVRHSLAGFPSRFERPEQRELAQSVAVAVESFATARSELDECRKIPAKPRSMRTFGVRSFRNLRDLTLDFGCSAVSADIIHGANGTGKSSLCEAISIALFGSSSRYKAFSDRTREKDVSAPDRAREYVTKYLTPLQEPRDEPRIAIDEEVVPLQLIPSAEIGEAEAAMAGTVLMQEESLDFAGMSALELGARVLRGYSGLADQVEQYVESQLVEANTNRQDFLRSFGLSASITKLTTAYERIARREIDRSLPGVPRALADWLDAVPGGEQLAWRWREWGDEPARAGLAGRLSFLDGSPSSMREEIRGWLEAFNSLAAQSLGVLEKIEARIGPLRDDVDQAAIRITSWGQWLQRPANEARSGGSAEAELLANKLHGLQAEQGRILEQGREAGRHLEHLEGVERYVKENWGRQHPAECPTCGADHAATGGIEAVIRRHAEQAGVERERLRGEYSLLKRQIDEAHRRLAELGQAQCPVSVQDRLTLAQSFGWMIPAGQDFAQWIAVAAQRERLLALLSALKQKPVVPPSVDAESEGDRVARELASQFKDACRMFEAPTNWKPVKEKLTATLADIVNTHLPRTLAALWSELYLNLTSAPWLLPERPSVEVASKRGEQRSTLQVGKRLARYILNQSEVHILGLGWFFTRYLTRGRFSHACLVMDDPAHELDQTSFGDLCRLWQIMLRLHRVYEEPLRLVVMLGQESRAIEAARATAGNLCLLGWTPEQKDAIQPTRAVPDGWRPPNAVRLFKKAAS